MLRIKEIVGFYLAPVIDYLKCVYFGIAVCKIKLEK